MEIIHSISVYGGTVILLMQVNLIASCILVVGAVKVSKTQIFIEDFYYLIFVLNIRIR